MDESASQVHVKIFRLARNAWVKLPESWRHRFWALAGPRWQSAYARQMIAKPASMRPNDPNAPLVVAGLFNSANGIGEGARSTYRALQAVGLNPIAVDLTDPFAPRDLSSDIHCLPMPANNEGTLILQLNAPETSSALQHLEMSRSRNWYTIGYWAWELPNFPARWEKAFRFLSEIWTISEFTAQALAQHPKAPKISVFGHAISPPAHIRHSRAKFGWQSDEFVFLTMADGMSSLQRKNPFAAIRAFQAAFGDDPSTRLIVKTRNLSSHETAYADLREAIGTASNINILNESLTDHERWTLLKSADALISFHRAEGFGLPLAEMMSWGKPVICTNWSGNMDFVDEDSAALVTSKLIPCEDRYRVYTETGTLWAEIDMADAVRQLKRVVQDKVFRHQIGKAARLKIRSVCSESSIGSQMRQHLAEIPSPDSQL